MTEPSLFAHAISTIIPCAGLDNAHVSGHGKVLEEQIMHMFYDNAAHTKKCTRFMTMQHMQEKNK